MVYAEGPPDALSGAIDFRVTSSGVWRPDRRVQASEPKQAVRGRELVLSDAPGGSRWRVSATTRDGRYAANDVIVTIPLEPSRLPVEPVLLRRVGAVSGRVMAPDGKPVAGAQLHATHYNIENPDPPSVTTDAEGRFRMPALGDFNLCVRASGFASANRQMNVVGVDQEEHADFVLGAPWELTGVLTDLYGAPLTGLASVSVYAGGDDCDLDASGRFRFQNLPRDGGVYLCWSDEQHNKSKWIEFPADIGSRHDVGAVAFDLEQKVEFRVVDGDGVPLEGLMLTARREGDESFMSIAPPSVWLESGRYTIRGCGFDATTTLELGRAPVAGPVVLVAKNLTQVRGRVVYEGSEAPDFSMLEYAVEGPDAIAAREALERNEPVPARIDPAVDDANPWSRSVSRDGSIVFCVSSAWREALVVVGTPASPFTQAQFDWEIAATRIPIDGRPVEVRIQRKQAMGFRVGLSSESAEIRDVALARPGWTKGMSPIDREAALLTFFPVEPGTWTLQVTTSDGRTQEFADASIEGPEWPTFEVKPGP